MRSVFGKFQKKTPEKPTPVSFEADCRTVSERWEEFVAGTLPEGEERTAIAAHIADCPRCQAERATYERMEAAWQVFAQAPVPYRPANWATLQARLATEPRPQANTAFQERRFPVLNYRAIFGGVAAIGLATVAVSVPLPWRPPVEFDAFGQPVTRVAPNPMTASNILRRGDTNAIQTNSLGDLGGYVTTGKNGTTLTVAPAFLDLSEQDIVPLVVDIGNPGPATSATIRVNCGERDYNNTVTLPAYGTKRLWVYPKASADDLTHTFVVTLSAPGRNQSVTVSNTRFVYAGTHIAYVGKKAVSISPNLAKWKSQAPSDDFMWPNMGRWDSQYSPKEIRWPYHTTYTTPATAPDQAIGYCDIDTIVLSGDASELSVAQWEAIKAWTLTGGRLILTDERLLKTAVGAELAPVQPEKTVSRTSNQLKPGAIAMPGSRELAGVAQPVITVGRFGVGSVLYTNFDPTAKVVRDNPRQFIVLWAVLHAFNGEKEETHITFRKSAHEREWFRKADTPELTRSNPFHTMLPPVNAVLGILLGYFVLVIPVSYVVLKHTNRQNLAWVTAPTLAIVFAGGMVLLTVSLHCMPIARRTEGVLFGTSGQEGARFLGNTEFFFPMGGRYRLPMGNADFVETVHLKSDRARPLRTDTREGQGTVTTLDVGNLAFRRLYHEQPARLPGTIVADLRQSAEGAFTGFIENNTGQTLQDVVLTKRVWTEFTRNWAHGTTTERRMVPVIYRLGTLPVGRTYLENRLLPRNMETGKQGKGARPFSAERDIIPKRLALLAKLPGASFGPQVGQDFSGNDSVTVVIGLSTQNPGGRQ